MVQAPVKSWSPSLSRCTLISDGGSADDPPCFTYTTSCPPMLSPTTTCVPYFSMNLHAQPSTGSIGSSQQRTNVNQISVSVS